MNRLLPLLFLLLFSQLLSAKVAYLPLLDRNSTLYPKANSIIAMNLINGETLASLDINDITSLFLDDSGRNLYLSAHGTIYQIDTATFSIANQWDNLGIQADRVVLNENNTKLYFTELNVGSGNSNLYQIDLNTNQVSSVLNFNDLSILDIVYSEDLSHFTLPLKNNSNGQFYLDTYVSNSLTLKHTSPVTSYYSIELNMIDNDGENLYRIKSSSTATVESIKLSDGSLNWLYTNQGETNFYTIYEQDIDTMVVSGENNSYQIDKQTGTGTSLFTQGNNIILSGSIHRDELNSFIEVKYPHVICIFGACGILSNLTINLVNLIDETHDNLLESQNKMGSRPVGRFIGENHYRGTAVVQQVPVLNRFGLILLMIGFLGFMSYRAIRLNK